MSVPCAEFWKLLRLSRLLSPERLEQVESTVARSPLAADHVTGEQVARYLVGKGILTQYQATLLLNGRPGPFLFGEYQVQDRQRSGRLKGLFRAVHLPTGHPVFLKFPPARLAQDARQWTISRRHVRAACELVDAHLQRVFALEEHTDYRFLVLETLSGHSLDVVLARQDRLPAQTACRLAQQAALGLAQLHAQGRVYGDVRPANCWLAPDEQLKLMRDSWLPPAVPDLSRGLAASSNAAAADYWAPELTHPGAPLNALTDIYALGCTLYQLLVGSVPFAGGDVAEKMQRHVAESPPPLARWGVPDPVSEIVASMLAKAPRDRIASTQELAARLQRIAEADDMPAPHPLPQPPTLTPWETRTAEPPPARRPPPITPDPPRRARPGEPARRPTAARVTRPRTITRSWIVAGVMLAVTGLLIGDAILRMRASRPPRPSSGTPTTIVTDEPTAHRSPPTETGPQVTMEGPYEIRQDDGILLWMTPTRGSPIPMDYVPPAPQWILAARPAEWVSTDQGRQAIQSLGPEFQQHLRRWESAAGFALDQIALVVMSLHDAEPEYPRAAFTVRLKQPVSEDQLRAAWRQPVRVPHANGDYYRGEGWSYRIVPAGDSDGCDRFVMGSEQDVREVVELDGAPPPVRGALSQLLALSDQDRHLTIVCPPTFLRTNLLRDGRLYFFGDARRLRIAMDWLLEDAWQACLLSLHLEETFYAEFRVGGDTDHNAVAVSDRLRERWQLLGERLERQLEQTYPPPYWRRVALRLPAMIRFVVSRARVGVEDRQALTNVVLPAEAAHNLLFAGQMLLAEFDEPRPQTTEPASPGPRTIEDLLASRLDLVFDQRSLESALEELAGDVRSSFPQLPFPFELQIAGSDLQLDGITRNQQITRFEARDELLSNILTQLVTRANPIATVTDPADPDQKLVWVVGPHPTIADRQIVLITTRSAAARHEYQLPSPFQPQ